MTHYFILLVLIAITITFTFYGTKIYYGYFYRPAAEDTRYPELIIDHISVGNGEETTLVTMIYRNLFTVIKIVYKNRVVKVFSTHENTMYDEVSYDLEGNLITEEQFNELFKDTELPKFKHLFDCMPYVSF